MGNINNICAFDERRRMIETAAYYRAERKVFADNDPLGDWLEAEKEIDAACRQPVCVGAGTQERAVYRRMQAEFKRILAGVQDKVNADTIRKVDRMIVKLQI